MEVKLSLIILSLITSKYYVFGETVTINTNITGIIGENGTEIVCSFTNTTSYPRYIFINAHRQTESSLNLATFNKNTASKLLSDGKYLEGRVTLTNITESSSVAVMTFVNLTCMDEMKYRCYANYKSSNGTADVYSNNSTLSIKVPPSRPDQLVLMTKAEDVSRTKPNHSKTSFYMQTTTRIDSLKKASSRIMLTMTSLSYNSTSLQIDNNIISTTVTSDTSLPQFENSATSSIESTASVPSIMENDFITFICSGNVGKPPGRLSFQMFKDQKEIRNYTDTATTENRILENCTYFATSNLTIQVTAEENYAIIRCQVISSMAKPDMYIDSEPLKIKNVQSTTFVPQTSSSGYSDTKAKLSAIYKVIIGVGGYFALLVLVLLTWYLVRRSQKSNKKSPDILGSANSLIEPKTGPTTSDVPIIDAYEEVHLDNIDPIISPVKSGHEVKDGRQNRNEYLNKQREEEEKTHNSITSPQPVIYTQVNEAAKAKIGQIKENQKDDTYADSMEGIYDTSGNRRHRVKEGVDPYDTVDNLGQQSQPGSSGNKTFENDSLLKKEEMGEEAMANPTAHSASDSQDDGQTYKEDETNSKKGFEQVHGTDQTILIDTTRRTSL